MQIVFIGLGARIKRELKLIGHVVALKRKRFFSFVSMEINQAIAELSLIRCFRSRMPACFILLSVFVVGATNAEAPQEKGSSQRSVLRGKPVGGKVVDRENLLGKVMCGYQGWFNCEGDGQGLGWTHWARNRRERMGPGNATVDLWPDVSELPAASRFATGFRDVEGRVAQVFSSASPDVVAMHFRWMREYGIDGVFLQRFANGLDRGRLQKHKDVVLDLVRQESVANGRVFALMYDLSGLRRGEVQRILDDWKRIRKEKRIDDGSSYLQHRGKPLVAIWGIGFNDGRRYTLEECEAVVDGFKKEGCSVMLGVPSWWREGKRDATDDPRLLELIRKADVVSPWTVGRYQNPEQAISHAKLVWQPDRLWCDRHHIDFLPVAFPGFSWHQLKGAELNAIPRLGGDFFWSQVYGASQTGCAMLYVAMFDEVDEGTAVFKFDSNPPISETEKFLTLEESAGDHYLRLVGEAAKGFRGERQIERRMP